MGRCAGLGILPDGSHALAVEPAVDVWHPLHIRRAGARSAAWDRRTQAPAR